MAAEDILAALQGLKYAPIESPYGIAGASIAQSLPQMITPTMSTGKALGLSLGSVLLSGLLGYQARRDAAAANLESAKLGLQLQSAMTPEARLGIIEQAGGGAMGDLQSRLLDYNNILATQEAARKQTVANKLAELEAAGQFNLGPLGTQLYERDLQKEVARQAAITGGFENRQELADKLMRERDLQRKILGRENVNVASPLMQRAIERNASSDLALDVAETIDQYKSIPEFAAAKNISAFGDDQLKSRLRNLATVVLQSRSGLAATDKERENLNRILTGDFTAVAPDTVSNILKRFAKDEKEIAAGTVAAGTQRPEDFVAEVLASAQEGRKSSFAPRIPSYVQDQQQPPAQTTIPPETSKLEKLRQLQNTLDELRRLKAAK